MSEIYEGNGLNFTFSGLTLEPKTITIPGWTKEELNISTLQNSAVHTKFVAALKDYGKLFITTAFDPSIYGSLPSTEQTLVITVPSVGTITFYAKISELDDISNENDVDSLVTFYKIYRAFVRGKVNSFQIDDRTIGEKKREEAIQSAADYFRLARAYII